MTLKYLWRARFENGGAIDQPEDDRYSKHDDEAEHNPSAFRDILDYEKVSPLVWFELNGVGMEEKDYAVNLVHGVFVIDGNAIYLEQPNEELRDRKLIYFRTMRKNLMTGEVECVAYNYGYEGKDDKGRVIKKVVTING